MLESWGALSESVVWKILQNFYISMGVDSWKRRIIPNRLTSNSYIAWQYAQMIVKHIEESSSDTDDQSVFTILELGAGHGKLGFLLLQHLKTLSQMPTKNLPKFRYVMTDLAERNIKFWQENEQFKPFIEADVLDFAVFNAGTDEKIKLINSGEVISTKNKADHIIAVANYFLDSLPLDYFKVADGKLYQCEAKIGAKEGEEVQDIMDPRMSDKLQLDWREEEISLPHYEDTEIDKVLSTYAEMPEDFYFNIPVGAYKTFNTLKSLCNNEIVLIAADKGFSSLEQMRPWYKKPPSLYCQGIYSFMVNFHALGEWFKNNGGFYEVTSQRNGLLELAVYCSEPLEKHKAIYQHFATSIEPFSPTDFYTLASKEKSKHFTPSLAKTLSIIRFSKYDPDIFYQYRKILRDSIKDSNDENIYDLKQALPKIIQMHYHLGVRNISLEIGRIYYRLKMYDKAIANYHTSLSKFGISDITYYNLGLCFYRIKSFDEALEAFEKSLRIKPDTKDTQKWIEKIKDKN